jgi:nucleoside-diphosphate-sugar epimerase
LVIDWTDGRTLTDLPDVGRILVAVSYDRHSQPSRFETLVVGLRRLLQALPQKPGNGPGGGPGGPHLCYISTTGVYHQIDGRWVDETSPTHPTREGGRAHLHAEQVLRRQCPHGGATILRLAGIYGPGRVPRASVVIAGQPIRSPAQGFLNLIHVDDAARTVMRVWDRAGGGQPLRRLYAVADDHPVIRGDFYRQIAKQCHAPNPRFESPPIGKRGSARGDTNKRVWNRRMKSDLMPRLQFPTYREGLSDVLRNCHGAGLRR